MEHTHISGLEGLITVLYVIAIMGALNLAAKKWKDKNPLLAVLRHSQDLHPAAPNHQSPSPILSSMTLLARATRQPAGRRY